MRLLLHVCCGPCTIFPLQQLRDQGVGVEGYFYNPNIHPYREFKKRIGALRTLSEMEKFAVEIDTNYGLTKYLQKVVFHENKRCSICYDIRLKAVAKRAGEKGFDAFSSTLLYSKYQNHTLLREKGEKFAVQYGVKFHYEDYRKGWQKGIDGAIERDLYRQPYCGCIYSEQERYDKKLRKRKSKAVLQKED